MTPRLPLFPLGTVLFPGLVLPLHVFEDRYRELVRHLMALPEGQNREFGVVAIRHGWEVQTPGDGPGTRATVSLHEVGCTAELRQVTEHPDGRFDIVTVGRRRFRISNVDDGAAPYLTAEVEWLPEPAGGADLADALAPRVLATFRRYLTLMRTDDGEVGEQLPEDPTVLSHLVAATAALTLADRQRLLAAPDTASRLRAELRLLSREAALLRRIRAVPVPLSELSSPPSPN
ncbi:LON peptidase substrate-binding domain-containing protein [Rhizomonospora bruguierae]|uniref:LON peptidase substrate-binding domain-containing protein n=1 Tax=Rhizomonospora bruguierae TaxID=1581705 RepID=UPI001BCADB54|nr:LON peptidase substrate-binding domain-containing protein [Micromonospora sp. NBRC 107566]